MATRKTITKKLRFEVFKRDNFTCQYCGRMAPDVILEVDHINAVKNGGTNDILNLTTSCFDCNRGKSKTKLSDNQELKKQQEQLKQLAEKQNQLKMMIEWQKELQKTEQMKIEFIKNEFEVFFDVELDLTETGEKTFRDLCIKNDTDLIVKAIKISFDRYYYEKNNKNLNNAIKKLSGICNNIKRQESDPIFALRNKCFYVCRKNLNYINDGMLRSLLNKAINNENDYECILDCLNMSSCWTDLREYIEEYIEV